MDSTDSDLRVSSKVVARVYKYRKKAFRHTFDNFLKSITCDPVVKALLNDATTYQHLTDRLEEVFQSIVESDREDFIDDLAQKLHKIEQKYSEKHIKEVKNMSSRLLNATREQNADEARMMRKMQYLCEQIRVLEAKLSVYQANEAKSKTDLKVLEETLSPPKYDHKDKEFYHFYAYADVTDLKIKVRSLQYEFNREFFAEFVKKTSKIMQLGRESAKSKINDMSTLLNGVMNEKIELENEIKVIRAECEEEIANQKKISEAEKLRSEEISDNMRKKIEELNQLLKQRDDFIIQCEIKQKEDENEKQRLSDLVFQQSAKAEKMTSDLLNCRNSLAEVVNTNNAYAAQLTQLQSEKSLLVEELENTKSELIQQEKAHKKLSEDFNEHEKELGHLKAVNPVITKDRDRLKAECARVQGENASLKEENHKLSSEIAKIVPQLQVTQQQLSEAEAKIAELNEGMAGQAAALEEKEQQITQQTQMLAEAAAVNEDKSSKLKKQEQELDQLQTDNTKLQQEIEELKAKLKRLSQQNDKVRKELLEQQLQNAKQNTELTNVTEERDELQNKNRDLQRSMSQVKFELTRVKDDLESAEKELKENQEQAHSHKIKAEDAEASNRKLSRDTYELTRSLEDTKAQLAEALASLSKYEDTNETAKAQIAQLSNEVSELRTFKDKYLDSSKKLEHAQEEVKGQENLIKELKSANEDLNTLNGIVDDISRVLSVDKKSLPKVIRDLYNSNNSLLTSLGVPSVEKALPLIKDMQSATAFLQKMQQIAPGRTNAELLKQYSSLIEENNRLLAEQRRISQLLSGEPNIDISATISHLVEKQSRISEQLNSAADFISQLLAIMTGPSNRPTRIVFPLAQDQQEKLIEVVTWIKQRADRDHDQVEEMLERAKNHGYDGTDCVEALEFILENTSSIDVNELNSRKQVKKLRGALVTQMDKNTSREESLIKEKESLSLSLNDARAEIANYRRIIEEIGRAVSGKIPDLRFLKAKLPLPIFEAIANIQIDVSDSLTRSRPVL